MTRDQMPKEDTLVERGVDDLLDEGYSPPDRHPASHDVGTTPAEQRQGESLAQRLDQEVPEGDALEQDQDADGAWTDDRLPDERAGRLVAPDQGAHPDTEKDVIAEDVGIAGGAASAEEAAMHVVPDDEL